MVILPLTFPHSRVRVGARSSPFLTLPDRLLSHRQSSAAWEPRSAERGSSTG